MEQLLTHTLNVITVQQPFTLAWNQAMQRMLPIRERQIAQVFTITEKQIEGVVRGSPRRNDVHKKMLAVVVADVEVDGEYQFERRRFSSSPDNLRLLAEWLIEREVEEVVMESTAQYWKPVWEALERYWKPICQKREGACSMSGAVHLAQAQSNRGPRDGSGIFPMRND